MTVEISHLTLCKLGMRINLQAAGKWVGSPHLGYYETGIVCMQFFFHHVFDFSGAYYKSPLFLDYFPSLPVDHDLHLP